MAILSQAAQDQSGRRVDLSLRPPLHLVHVLKNCLLFLPCDDAIARSALLCSYRPSCPSGVIDGGAFSDWSAETSTDVSACDSRLPFLLLRLTMYLLVSTALSSHRPHPYGCCISPATSCASNPCLSVAGEQQPYLPNVEHLPQLEPFVNPGLLLLLRRVSSSDRAVLLETLQCYPAGDRASPPQWACISGVSLLRQWHAPSGAPVLRRVLSLKGSCCGARCP